MFRPCSCGSEPSTCLYRRRTSSRPEYLAVRPATRSGAGSAGWWRNGPVWPAAPAWRLCSAAKNPEKPGKPDYYLAGWYLGEPAQVHCSLVCSSKRECGGRRNGRPTGVGTGSNVSSAGTEPPVAYERFSWKLRLDMGSRGRGAGGLRRGQTAVPRGRLPSIPGSPNVRSQMNPEVQPYLPPPDDYLGGEEANLDRNNLPQNNPEDEDPEIAQAVKLNAHEETMRQLAAQYNQLVAESALRNNLVVDPAALLPVQGANAGGKLVNVQSPVDNGRDSRDQPNPLTSTQLVQNPVAAPASNPNARICGYGQGTSGTDGAGGERASLLSGAMDRDPIVSRTSYLHSSSRSEAVHARAAAEGATQATTTVILTQFREKQKGKSDRCQAKKRSFALRASLSLRCHVREATCGARWTSSNAERT